MQPKAKDLSNYSDFYIVFNAATEDQIESTEKFIREIEKFIKSNLPGESVKK